MTNNPQNDSQKHTFISCWYQVPTYDLSAGQPHMVGTLPPGLRVTEQPLSGATPWSKKWQPTSVFLPGKSHGQRNLASYSSWGHKELDMTERLSTSHVAAAGGRKNVARGLSSLCVSIWSRDQACCPEGRNICPSVSRTD